MRALAWGVLLAATTAHADATALSRELGGADEARAIEAAQKLGQAGDSRSLEALLGAVGDGAPPKVTAAIARALTGKRDGRAVAALVMEAHHRAPEVRKAALAALTPSSDKRSAAALVAALGDSDGEVRAVAAKALGERRERSAEPRLIKLMEHRDPAAAPALAAIATPELAHRLSEMLGQLPDDLLCATLGEMLKRTDFGPDPIRVEVVRTLSKVPGADSTAALVEYLAATQRDKARPSRLEAQKVIDERSRQ
jgi:HEAT repeat protein